MSRDGQTQTLNSSKLYSVKSGGAAMIYEDGQVSSMRQLSSETLDSVSSLSAMAGNQEYALAEDVQVLLRDGSKYYQTSLSQINGEGYRAHRLVRQPGLSRRRAHPHYRGYSPLTSLFFIRKWPGRIKSPARPVLFCSRHRSIRATS